jgi:hypothetical protein
VITIDALGCQKKDSRTAQWQACPELVEVSYSKAFQRRAGILKIDLFFNIHKKP